MRKKKHSEKRNPQQQTRRDKKSVTLKTENEKAP